MAVFICGKKKMSAHRRIPAIHEVSPSSSQTKPDDSVSCVWLPLTMAVLYFVLSAIARVASGLGSKLDQVVCYAALICFMIVMLLGARNLYQDSRARKAETKRWIERCKTALLPILTREIATSTWYEYSGRYINTRDSLELRMNSDQKAVSPNQTIVRVEVSHQVYNRLAKRNTVRIYYMPESPLAFLLEDEL